MTPDKPITIAVAILGSVLALMLPRRYAILPLALSLCLYPSNMIMPPDGLGLTAQRVIAVFLLGRCIASRAVRSTSRWGLPDTVAAAYFGLLFVSQLMSQGINQALVNRGGFFLSAMAPFWCVRFLIVDRATFNTLFKGLLWAAMPLAVLGVVHMNTGYSPYYAFMRFGPFFEEANKLEHMRQFMGSMYFRAHAPFLQCIMFGWFFALLALPATSLYFERRRVMSWIIPWLFLPLGVISSIAAGPMMLTAFSLFTAALFPVRQYWKAMLGAAAAMLLALTLVSSRSPMEILANLGMHNDSSWYRVGLQNMVLKYGGMSGAWLQGFGEVPGHFARFHDLCIHWVMLLVFNGLMGFVGFYAVIFVAFRQLWQASARCASLDDQWLIWALRSTLIASLLAMMVVALFSEMYYIYHMFLGVLMNAGLLVGQSQRQVGLLVNAQGQQVLLRYTLEPGQRLAVVTPAGNPAAVSSTGALPPRADSR